ncbi:MAG: ASPIC/UnbV domain-containing protein [Planctomycetes bacterium]|nr:ASPIC/UnbV domain-containing protein [Planctomycetota bacterium]
MPDYMAGWEALNRQMDRGASWSGSERNNAFLNLGDGTFADASALLGIDFKDDARAVVTTDWDGDGDLDVWLRNRTGPQLRLLRNDMPRDRHWIAFELVGTHANRDAIGARVTVEAGGRRMVRTVSSGDGYLSQSSRRLHFGLGETEKIDRITIVWPRGGSEVMGSRPVDALYRIRQGWRAAERVERNVAALQAGPPMSTPTAGTVAIPLRVPLPLPPSIRSHVWGEAAPTHWTALNLWSRTCVPCRAELGDWSKNRSALEAAGIDVVALGVDEDDPEASARWFASASRSAFPDKPLGAKLREIVEALVLNVRRLDTDLVLPTTLLVDDKGAIQVIYLGKTPAKDLIADRSWMGGVPPHQRSLRGGRWFFSMPRDWGALAAKLRHLGNADDASVYDK